MLLNSIITQAFLYKQVIRGFLCGGALGVGGCGGQQKLVHLVEETCTCYPGDMYMPLLTRSFYLTSMVKTVYHPPVYIHIFYVFHTNSTR